MTLITEEYRQQLDQLHQSRADFGKRGSMWAESVMALCATLDTTDVLDYGCGKGELNLHLPFGIQCYDPGVPKYAKPPRPADILICTDVLEHIEPECLDDVLAHIAVLTKKFALLVIHTGPAIKTLPDGRNAHLIQQPLDWWQEKAGQYLRIRDGQQHGITALITAEPNA